MDHKTRLIALATTVELATTIEPQPSERGGFRHVCISVLVYGDTRACRLVPNVENVSRHAFRRHWQLRVCPATAKQNNENEMKKRCGIVPPTPLQYPIKTQCECPRAPCPPPPPQRYILHTPLNAENARQATTPVQSIQGMVKVQTEGNERKGKKSTNATNYVATGWRLPPCWRVLWEQQK